MTTHPLSLAILRLPYPMTAADADAINALIEARYRLHQADRAKYLQLDPRALESGDECDHCGGLLLEDRVVIDWSGGIGVVQPCPRCRRVEYCEFQARRAIAEALESEPEPPTLRSGDLAGGVTTPAAEAKPRLTEPAGEVKPSAGSAAEGDPWDLASEEEAEGPRAIRMTALELAKADGWRPPSLGRDRADDDGPDNKSDIQPFERTTSYPWGPR